MTSEKFEEFYSAFTNCAVTRAALAAGEYSTENPERWLKAAFATKASAPATNFEALPLPLQLLLDQQQHDGRWVDASRVNAILGVQTQFDSAPATTRQTFDEPLDMADTSTARSVADTSALTCTDTSDSATTHWKWTTALAVAFIRHQIEYFDVTIDYHDKAMKWMTALDVRLLDDAREAIAERLLVSNDQLLNFVAAWEREEIRRTEDYLSLTTADQPAQQDSSLPSSKFIAAVWGQSISELSDNVLNTLMAYDLHISEIKRIVKECNLKWRYSPVCYASSTAQTRIEGVICSDDQGR